MAAEEKRLERLRTLDEEIAAKIHEDLRAGVLAQTPGFGKPLTEQPGFEQTPEEWRMPMKILKDAGYAPPEVQMLNLRAVLQAERRLCTDRSRQLELDQQIQDLSLKISFQLDRFR